jgi:hypothetical protein
MSTVGFWRELKQDARDINIQSNRLGKIGRPWYIFPDGNGPRGSFKSFTDLAPNLRSRDVIILGGVLREQAVAPLGVFDISVIGAANLPRQATSSGVPTGGGACWLAPASGAVATKALIEVIQQGWSFENIFFAPLTNSPAIQATRAEDAVHPDPSHLLISGCKFAGGVGGEIGYEDSGGCNDVVIQDCDFFSLATAIKGIAGAGIADPLANKYLRNYFHQNTNDIVIGCSYGIIQGNRFKNTTTQKVDLTAGGHESVILNFFDDATLDIDPAHGYTGSATGTWLNYNTDNAALTVGQPA